MQTTEMKILGELQGRPWKNIGQMCKNGRRQWLSTEEGTRKKSTQPGSFAETIEEKTGLRLAVKKKRRRKTSLSLLRQTTNQKSIRIVLKIKSFSTLS